MIDKPLTLDDLRKMRDAGDFGHVSRFRKSQCPKCGALITNQAMGRKAHMMAHKKAEERKRA